MIYLRRPNHKRRDFKEYAYIEFDPSTLTFKEFMDRVGEALTTIMDRKFDYATFLVDTYIEVLCEEHDSDMRVGYYKTYGGALLDNGTHSQSDLIYAAVDAMNEMFQNPNEDTPWLKECRFTFSNRVQAIRTSRGRRAGTSTMDDPRTTLFEDNEFIVNEMHYREKAENEYFEKIAQSVKKTKKRKTSL